MAAIPTEKPHFGVLDDVKIVFAAMEEAIPRACNIMADWGADVTWLENTGYGDTVRDAKNAAQAERRNCRSVQLNQFTPGGKQVLLDMLKDTDIFFESSKGGTWERKGFTDEDMWAVNPKLIMADEPVSALDVSIQAQVLNLLRDVQEQYNLTYLFISHDLAVVEMISDRIGVMYLGTIMEVAPNEELYSNPQHPYTQALLSAVPIPDPTIEKKHVLIEGDLPSPTNIPSGCPFHTRCPHATEKCSAEVPPTKEVKPGHFVNCHYPGREL